MLLLRPFLLFRVNSLIKRRNFFSFSVKLKFKLVHFLLQTGNRVPQINCLINLGLHQRPQLLEIDIYLVSGILDFLELDLDLLVVYLLLCEEVLEVLNLALKSFDLELGKLISSCVLISKLACLSSCLITLLLKVFDLILKL